jgi:hypothetical protein
MALQTSQDRFNGVIASLAIKAPCVVVAVANIALEGEQTIDNIAVVVGDRVLVIAQTDPVENGIYNVATSAWQRTFDFDGNRDITRGTTVNVNRDLGASEVYEVTNIPDPEISVDPIDFRLYYRSEAILPGGPLNPAGFTIINQVLNSQSGVLTIDYTLGQGVTVNLIEDVTSVIFLNVPAGANVTQLELDIRQDSTAWTIAWPSSILWPNTTEPDLSTVDSITQVHLRSTLAGAEWLGTFSENHG